MSIIPPEKKTHPWSRNSYIFNDLYFYIICQFFIFDKLLINYRRRDCMQTMCCLYGVWEKKFILSTIICIMFEIRFRCRWHNMNIRFIRVYRREWYSVLAKSRRSGDDTIIYCTNAHTNTTHASSWFIALDLKLTTSARRIYLVRVCVRMSAF